jgi:hypothetical protein
MTVYAVFLCFAAAGYCQPMSTGEYAMGVYIPAKTYESLKRCQTALLDVYAGGNDGRHPKLDATGRYVFNGGTEWLVCLHKHMDTWQSP